MVFGAEMTNTRKHWRGGTEATVCVVLATVFAISLSVRIYADITMLGRWMGAICGEWAPPSSKYDPRCDDTLFKLKWRAVEVARWSGSGLCLASTWWTFRNRRVLWQKFLGEDVRKL